MVLCIIDVSIGCCPGKKKSSGVRSVPSKAAADGVTSMAPIVSDNGDGGHEVISVHSSASALSRLSVSTQEGTANLSSSSTAVGARATIASAGLKNTSAEPKRLLVTYDNNDPEFDEDSDPDGDLEF